jgi:hypothetical protein
MNYFCDNSTGYGTNYDEIGNLVIHSYQEHHERSISSYICFISIFQALRCTDDTGERYLFFKQKELFETMENAADESSPLISISLPIVVSLFIKIYCPIN